MKAMKTIFIKLVGPAIAVVAFGLVFILNIHAQPGVPQSSTPPATTNWVGYVVAGETPTIDPMPGTGPQPTTLRKVEIELRSDGGIVWRVTPKPKNRME
jgi:hypothetical protein